MKYNTARYIYICDFQPMSVIDRTKVTNVYMSGSLVLKLVLTAPQEIFGKDYGTDTEFKVALTDGILLCRYTSHFLFKDLEFCKLLFEGFYFHHLGVNHKLNLNVHINKKLIENPGCSVIG